MHPTVKPVALVADASGTVTAKARLVLDPFGGSGTTLLAAERIGRRCAADRVRPRSTSMSQSGVGRSLPSLRPCWRGMVAPFPRCRRGARLLTTAPRTSTMPVPWERLGGRRTGQQGRQGPCLVSPGPGFARLSMSPRPRKPGGGDYEVGYCRPPVASRFQPGQSGNPKGRPRAKKSVGDHLREALMTRVKVVGTAVLAHVGPGSHPAQPCQRGGPS